MRLYSAFVLMEYWPYRQVSFQGFEGLFDGDQLDVILPERGRVTVGEVGAQQVAPFAPADLAQLFAVEREGEAGCGLGDLDVDQAPSGGRLGTRSAQLHQ